MKDSSQLLKCIEGVYGVSNSIGGDSDLGAQAQVWGRSNQPGVVATVSGAGSYVPGLQRGASGEAGSDPP